MALGCFAAAPGCEGKQRTHLADKSKTQAPIPEATEFDEAANRPATPKTVFAYARVLSAQRQDSACDLLLSKLISDHPRFRAAYLLQAEVRMRQRRIDDAVATLRAGLRLFPRDDVLTNNLGICFLMKSDCTNALWQFTQAAALKPSHARYRANMAMALGLMGRQEESLSLYNLVLSPSDAKHNLTVLDYARKPFFGENEAPPELAPPTTSEVETPAAATSTNATATPTLSDCPEEATHPLPEPARGPVYGEP